MEGRVVSVLVGLGHGSQIDRGADDSVLLEKRVIGCLFISDASILLLHELGSRDESEDVSIGSKDEEVSAAGLIIRGTADAHN